MSEYVNETDFTENAMNLLQSVVEDGSFAEEDSRVIYRALRQSFRITGFSDYLKRYLYDRAELSEPFSSVSLSVYQTILAESFRDRLTPASFEPDSLERISSMTRNWLTQNTTNRRVVLLLGFGLGMSEEDVRDFLTKALRETDFDSWDPFEMICLFCYRHRLGYPCFERLRQQWEDMKKNPASQTADAFSCGALDSEEKLLNWLAGWGNTPSPRLQAAQDEFQALYRETCETIAGCWTDERFRNPDKITPSDLEHVLCAAIPLDRYNNLVPARGSALNRLFEGKRISRQRISALLRGSVKPARFDLITLSFLCCAASVTPEEEKASDAGQRYHAFCEKTNRILTACGYGELYAAIGYECFLMMCILTDDPLESYAEVWEQAYRKEAHGT